MNDIQKIGLGGGCHWCTEAVFQSLTGVQRVEQGYINSTEENSYFSEAVLIYFDPKVRPLRDLIEVHLHTHKSTSNHSFRKKYRSAIYYFGEGTKDTIKNHLKEFQKKFEDQIITKVLQFQEFKSSRVEFLNYYQNNPEKPFCKKYIIPKLEVLKDQYANMLK